MAARSCLCTCSSSSCCLWKVGIAKEGAATPPGFATFSKSKQRGPPGNSGTSGNGASFDGEPDRTCLPDSVNSSNNGENRLGLEAGVLGVFGVASPMILGDVAITCCALPAARLRNFSVTAMLAEASWQLRGQLCQVL